MSDKLLESLVINIDIFIEIFSLINSVSGETINIQFKKNKKIDNPDINGEILITSINENRTIMNFGKLNHVIFSKLMILGTHDISIWVDIKEIMKFFDTITSKNNIMEIYVDKNDNAIKFIVRHKTKSNDYVTYEQPLIEPDSQEQKLKAPKIPYDYTIEILSNNLKKICTNIKKFSKYIELICNKSQLQFRCITKNNKTYLKSCVNTANLDTDEPDDEIENNVLILATNPSQTTEISSNFLIELLLKLKHSSICDTLIIKIGNNKPMCVDSILQQEDIVYGKLITYISNSNSNITDKKYNEYTQNVYTDVQANIK